MKKKYELIYKINPKLYYQLRYFIVRRKFIRFKQPRNLSEFLLVAMTRPDFAQYAQYADKVKVRDFIKAMGYESSLPQLYGIWDNANDIIFDLLPNRFALKTNHGCGNHVICRDKSLLNINDSIVALNHTLSQKYNITEPHYQHLSPYVFAEEFIEDGSGFLPIDYKFMCVKGNPMCILVCSERGEHTQKATYSIDWEPLPWTNDKIQSPSIPKPTHLAEMIQMARDLSKNFDFVRVDLYDCPERIIFGELTFSPAEGFLNTFKEEALILMNPGNH